MRISQGHMALCRQLLVLWVSHSPCTAATRLNRPFTSEECRDIELVGSRNELTGCGNRVTTTSLLISSRQFSDRDAEICSYKAMLNKSLIRQLCSGIHHLLPMGLRALEKLITLIDKHMRTIGAVKMAMPLIAPASLWKKTGRWDEIGQELFQLDDRHKSLYCLSPTHEEVVSSLIRNELVSRKQLPLKIYQLDRKFRDELRPKHGLLRAREFWMKDLYSFDDSVEDAIHTYEVVCNCYEGILRELNLPILNVKADSGNIGGSLSSEYHIPSEVGESKIVSCDTCNLRSCKSMVSSDGFLAECPKELESNEKLACQLSESRGIEVAHTFFLGTKYSKTFNVGYGDGNKSIVQMGCYGIGVSRLLAATIEYGCAQQSERLVWPQAIAPYPICVVPMAQYRDSSLMARAVELYDTVNHHFPGEVVIEDRMHLSIGARIRHLEKQGYLASIVVGDKVEEGKIELHLVNKLKQEEHIIHRSELVEVLQSYFVNQ